MAVWALSVCLKLQLSSYLSIIYQIIYLIFIHHISVYLSRWPCELCQFVGSYKADLVYPFYICLSIYVSILLSIYQSSIYPSYIYLSIHHISIYLSRWLCELCQFVGSYKADLVYQSILHLSIHHISVYLSRWLCELCQFVGSYKADLVYLSILHLSIYP